MDKIGCTSAKYSSKLDILHSVCTIFAGQIGTLNLTSAMMKCGKDARRVLRCSVALLMLVLSACTTSKTTVSNTVNLARYEYASVVNNETYYPAELMEYEIQLFDAVESSGLQMVGDSRIYDLDLEQRKKLLLVKYGISQTNEEAIVTVNFIDYTTGRPVVSCRGAFGLGIDYAADMRGAIKRVSAQIAKTFPKR